MPADEYILLRRLQGKPSWWKLFSATLAANVLAGIILFLGFRLYIHWSITDTLKKIDDPPAKREPR